MQTCMDTSCTKLAVTCLGVGGASFVSWRKSAEKPGSVLNGHGCSGQHIHQNTNGIMVWAWMLWSAHSSKYERYYYGLGMDALVSVMLVEHERNYGLGMDALVSTFIKIRTELWFGHGCSDQHIHQNTNGIIMVWAWMLWSA